MESSPRYTAATVIGGKTTGSIEPKLFCTVYALFFFFTFKVSACGWICKKNLQNQIPPETLTGFPECVIRSIIFIVHVYNTPRDMGKKGVSRIEKRGQYSLRFARGRQPTCNKTNLYKKDESHTDAATRTIFETRTDERTDGRADDTTAYAALSKRTKRSRPGWSSARHPPSAPTASHDRVTDDGTRSFRSNGKMAKIRAVSTCVRRALVSEPIFVHFPFPTDGLRTSLGT